MIRRSRTRHASYLKNGRDENDWVGDVQNVLAHGCPDSGDCTTAFQSAVDAAHNLAADVGDSTLSLSGDVVVPFRPQGYQVAGLQMRSHVRLLGLGSQVLITNPGNSGEHCIMGIGSEQEDGVFRRTEIRNFGFRGNTNSGHGIYFEEHDNNVIAQSRFKSHGGNGIHGQKEDGGAKSDGLIISGCWLDDNRGDGVYLGSNSHYCDLTDGCRIVNNDGYNFNVSCVGFNVWGGVYGGGSPSRLWNSNAGGIWGATFEATPFAPADMALLEVGHAVDGAARGFTLMANKFLGSGNLGDLTLCSVVTASGLRIQGGHMDANSAGNVVGIAIGAGSENTVVDRVSFDPNIGAGGFTNTTTHASATGTEII